MKYQYSMWGMFFVAVLLSSCSKSAPEEPRVPTSPVVGVVHVDGKAASLIEVTCHPDGASELKHPVSSFTDDEGRFSFATYVQGDGLPVGGYTLTFSWLEMGITAKDKFKGKFSSPKKSTTKFDVKGGGMKRLTWGRLS